MSGIDDIEEIERISFQCGLDLHRELGPGLLESVYEILLAKAFEDAGLSVARQVKVPIRFRGIEIENGFRCDLLVEDKLLIELKSTEFNNPVNGKQVLTYLRLMGLRLGFLMNFGQSRFSDGFSRIANDYYGTIPR